jgi:hypothetical protein
MHRCYLWSGPLLSVDTLVVDDFSRMIAISAYIRLFIAMGTMALITLLVAFKIMRLRGDRRRITQTLRTPKGTTQETTINQINV